MEDKQAVRTRACGCTGPSRGILCPAQEDVDLTQAVTHNQRPKSGVGVKDEEDRRRGEHCLGLRVPCVGFMLGHQGYEVTVWW